MAYAPQRQHQIMPLVWPMECVGLIFLEKQPNRELITSVFLPFGIESKVLAILGTGSDTGFDGIPSWCWGSLVLRRSLYLTGCLVVWARSCLDVGGLEHSEGSCRIPIIWTGPPAELLEALLQQQLHGLQRRLNGQAHWSGASVL